MSFYLDENIVPPVSFNPFYSDNAHRISFFTNPMTPINKLQPTIRPDPIFKEYPVFRKLDINAEYRYSANAIQGIVALVEAMAFLDGRFTTDLLYAGIIFVSTFIPPSGINGYGYEKQMEIIAATLGTSIIMKLAGHGGFLKNALRGFMLSTSSMGFTNELYLSFYPAKEFEYIKKQN